MKRPSEFDIQRALCIWLDGEPDPKGVPRKTPPLYADAIYWHTPNGGARDAREGARFRQIGVKAGIPDMFFLRQGRLFGLEMKAPGGATSPAQDKMLPRLELAGCKCAVVDSLEAARAQLFAWGLIQLR